MQTTLEKAYRSYTEGMTIKKAYLLRIAKNAWIDGLRKKSSSEQYLEDMQMDNLQAETDFHLRESFELLASRLSIRQSVLLLMIDVFGFSAKKTALHIGSTEGAVKEALKRTRLRLAKLAADPDGTTAKAISHPPDERMNTGLLDVFVEAFRSGNVHRIYQSYQNIRSSGMEVARVWHNEEYVYFDFCDPDGHLLRVTSKKFR
jgi:RNA polymerase sigma-70 factor (ECF subfamily)